MVPYETVSSQAIKNVQYLSTSKLLERLKENVGSRRPATWTNGNRVNDREALIEFMQIRDPRDLTEVVIVQPHVAREQYEPLRDPDHPQTPRVRSERLRLRLLDALLHSARSMAIGGGATDLRVVGSRH